MATKRLHSLRMAAAFLIVSFALSISTLSQQAAAFQGPRLATHFSTAGRDLAHALIGGSKDTTKGMLLFCVFPGPLCSSQSAKGYSFALVFFDIVWSVPPNSAFPFFAFQKERQCKLWQWCCIKPDTPGMMLKLTILCRRKRRSMALGTVLDRSRRRP